MARDHRVGSYINDAPPFAQPILEHLRDLVHEVCPEVEEDIKWSMPFFNYKGTPICSMAAFKQHCAFGFWRYKDLVGGKQDDGMGQFGKLTSLKDLPPGETLAALIRKAMTLNETGVRTRRARAAAKPAPKPAPILPEDLATLLAMEQHAAARKTYESFTPGAQREYVSWITEAKADATRQRRIASTLEWLAQGKRRNWKYE
ncbi:YdeI/OmpD-associated family protein [Dyella telluris]|uniref:YdeI/OmpD-associated family protein n=1 Tax=Dyella telluris TaxID=2763498 RepID=A0A7G8Q1F2_9GAMM|nr:YdeI/OmpD-associated family protein [Dyella telluris]QNK00610.1 YdeI/OmpD-associated family protein [Dyella telluris]